MAENGGSEAVEVQVFGTRKSANTRKALRFFSERQVKAHFVDFSVRGPSPGELRRFAATFGIASLIDRQARRFLELGLTHSTHADAWWEETLVREPGLLRMPLVRCGHRLSVGLAEAEWNAWLGRSS